MLGGTKNNLKNGTHLRELANQSVGKSQLLRAIMNIAPLAISTTSQGYSGVGLHLQLLLIKKQVIHSYAIINFIKLEADAMVLADREVVCIDKFDKMNDQDCVAIHEVMQQQIVTIAKAGIHASLNAQCSVVAAANPIYGTYHCSLTTTKNIGLLNSLLSPFDLLFIVLDQMEPGIDRHISEHVLRMHSFCTQYKRDDEGDANSTVFVKYNPMLYGTKTSRKRETLTIDFLKKYIHYAKHRIQPELTDKVSDQIATAYYAELRSTSSNAKTKAGTLPITARTLETIVHLSTAPKIEVKKPDKSILKADVDAALQVLNFAIYHQKLTEIKEHKQEKERKCRSENNASDTGRPRHQGARNDRENGDAFGRTE
ncbi:unnamed protein product [Coffea canephora]|uniref:DNA replication licensing factor MCM3 n=1 Tax=Coffea canephora TaxID=49390 RepID=A0A068UVZ2_COFCA|nr:unnamed protein product [Coffea canephora]